MGKYIIYSITNPNDGSVLAINCVNEFVLGEKELLQHVLDMTETVISYDIPEEYQEGFKKKNQLYFTLNDILAKGKKPIVAELVKQDLPNSIIFKMVKDYRSKLNARY